MEGKSDRRVRKTRMLLRGALCQLMREKRVSDITVREIADICDINRGTFYLHYKDVFDMVEQIERELVEQFNEVMKDFTPEKMCGDPCEPLVRLFTFLRDNADVARVLVGPNGDMAFVERMKKMVRDRCRETWPNLFPPGAANRFPYYMAYIISGCVGVIENWLRGEMEETPEQMAALAESLILGSVAPLGTADG